MLTSEMQTIVEKAKTTGWILWSGESRGAGGAVASAWYFNFRSGNKFCDLRSDNRHDRAFAVRSRSEKQRKEPDRGSLKVEKEKKIPPSVTYSSMVSAMASLIWLQPNAIMTLYCFSTDAGAYMETTSTIPNGNPVNSFPFTASPICQLSPIPVKKRFNKV